MPGTIIKVGLYGENGHQIQNLLEKSPLAKLVATAAFSHEKLPPSLQQEKVRSYATLDALLEDSEVDLVSLCSPRRKDQARDAIRALRAGKDVFAEKPCAMDEAELDEIMATAHETGRMFHEMAGSAFGQPYLAMRDIVRAGKIGEVVQVNAEKSYPYYEGRPQDEEIDGGLICQNAVHAFRFVEHVTGVGIASVRAAETTAGNPIAGGELHLSSVILLTLQNNGLASITANYLNPRGTGVWGYESLRIFGTLGMIESTQGGTQTRLVIGEKDFGPIDVTAPGLDYFDAFLRTLLGQGEMPMTLEEELSPTRWALRAKKAAIDWSSLPA